MTTTRAQRLALFEIFSRNQPAQRPLLLPREYRAFRRTCWYEWLSRRSDGTRTIMVPWSGMLLGIEPDGYTHS
jgi:hypothetical protein